MIGLLMERVYDEDVICEEAMAMGHPVTNVGEYVFELAKRHGVSYAKTPADKLAEAITKLSDDDVEMDRIELLIIALERAGVISGAEVVPLHVNYLREKLGV